MAPILRRWTAEDNEMLKGLASRRPADEIAKRLGRSVGATFVQASKLGISLRVPIRGSEHARASNDRADATEMSDFGEAGN